MDTREKIINIAQALKWVDQLRASGRPLRVVTGHFDPLLAAHATRLETFRQDGELMVIVTDPPQPLLPSSARVELVAAMASVDRVAHLTERQVESVIAGLKPVAAQRFEEDDELLRTALVKHIRQRTAHT